MIRNIELTDRIRQFLEHGARSCSFDPEIDNNGICVKDVERSSGYRRIPVPDYVDENVSTKVGRVIQSYVGMVNKMVWRKF